MTDRPTMAALRVDAGDDGSSPRNVRIGQIDTRRAQDHAVLGRSSASSLLPWRRRCTNGS